MTSKIREHIAGATYHTYSRCIAKENLMKDDKMKELMLTVIKETKEKFRFKLNAFEIPDNHFHFIIQTVNDTHNISKIMQRIKSVFAKRYNKLVGRCGPVWNERFGSKIIEKAKDAAKYMLYLLWYLAYNSYRKNKVNDPREYMYGSINCYLNENHKSRLKITLHDAFLNLGRTFKERLKNFLEYEKYYVEGLLSQRW